MEQKGKKGPYQTNVTACSNCYHSNPVLTLDLKNERRKFPLFICCLASSLAGAQVDSVINKTATIRTVSVTLETMFNAAINNIIT